MLGEIDDARRLGEALGGDGASRLLAELDAAEEDLHILNANKKLVIEALLLGVYERTRPAAV